MCIFLAPSDEGGVTIVSQTLNSAFNDNLQFTIIICIIILSQFNSDTDESVINDVNYAVFVVPY